MLGFQALAVNSCGALDEDRNGSCAQTACSRSICSSPSLIPMEEQDKGRKLTFFFSLTQPLKKRCIKRCNKPCIPLFSMSVYLRESTELFSLHFFETAFFFFFFLFCVWLRLGMIHYFCPLVVLLACRLQLKEVILFKRGAFKSMLLCNLTGFLVGTLSDLG